MDCLPQEAGQLAVAVKARHRQTLHLQPLGEVTVEANLDLAGGLDGDEETQNANVVSLVVAQAPNHPQKLMDPLLVVLEGQSTVNHNWNCVDALGHLSSCQLHL